MPSGIKTWLPSELKKQKAIAQKLIDVFEAHSFEEIEIPTIVDMSVLEKVNTKFSEDVFKLVDRDGSTLALRTELTQPIAKLIATRSSELSFPVKLFYNSSIFRHKGIATDDSREIRQIGVEYFGDDETISDQKILKVFIESIEALDLGDYSISITHSSIWHRIFQLYGKDDAQEAYDLILNGEMLKLKEFVSGRPLEALLKATCIEDIEKAFDMDLSHLRSLLSISDKVKFEPLQCPDLNLYTGVHFNLYTPGQGKLLAIGGRYDRLCNDFASDINQGMAAIGFAFYLPRLMSHLENPQNKKILKIAVSKGTLLDGAVDFINKIGIDFNIGFTKRRLIHRHKSPYKEFDEVNILKVRGHDVPTYVEHGAADLGIVGLDTVIDSGADLVKLKDLNYGGCRLCVCAVKGQYKSAAELPSYTRVATTFPNISKDYFAKKGIDVEIIHLYGSVELGPLTELSDVIVDLVATGKTLEENNLEVIEEIMDCSAFLVANRASFKLFKSDFIDLL